MPDLLVKVQKLLRHHLAENSQDSGKTQWRRSLAAQADRTMPQGNPAEFLVHAMILETKRVLRHKRQAARRAVLSRVPWVLRGPVVAVLVVVPGDLPWDQMRPGLAAWREAHVEVPRAVVLPAPIVDWLGMTLQCQVPRQASPAACQVFRLAVEVELKVEAAWVGQAPWAQAVLAAQAWVVLGSQAVQEVEAAEASAEWAAGSPVMVLKAAVRDQAGSMVDSAEGNPAPMWIPIAQKVRLRHSSWPYQIRTKKLSRSWFQPRP